MLVGPDGEVIGEGYHAELGGLHAERAALEDCRARGADPAGATLYVTLEPCAHSGRQPPCSEAILEAGIAAVVYASEDPTEKASGRGPGILRDGGVEVELAGGAETAAARLLNQPFRKRARTGRPLVTYKAAMTLDGRVAAPGGDSRWISGAPSRELVHRWRSECDAIAVGIGTALADDPLLTARLGEDRGRPDSGAENPIRVVFDSHARLPLDSALGRLDRRGAAAGRLRARGPDRRALRAGEGRGGGARRCRAVSAERASSARSTSSAAATSRTCFVEGGPTLAGALFDAGEIDRLRLFVAPVLLGAGEARAVLEGEGAKRIAEGQRPLAIEHEQVGEDLLITARLREW